MNVTKRDGRVEKFDKSKIRRVVQWAVEGLSDVSGEEVIDALEVTLYDEIKTTKLHDAVVQAAVNLISLDQPNYIHVAGRLLTYHLRKEVWGGVNPPSLYDLTQANVSAGWYTPELLEWYSAEEFDFLNAQMDHERDYLPYAGVRQFMDKYLVQDRVTKRCFETPQYAYMLIAMTLFHSYTHTDRLDWVLRAYKAFSLQKINLPTPQLAGLRTTTKQFASCALLEIADTMPSLAVNNAAVALATAERFGIGVGMSSIRGIGSPVRNGQTVHTGVVPFARWLEGAVKSCQQAGLRGGSATVNFTIFHPEIMSILSLKNDTGTEETRARKLDYAIWISGLLYERMLSGQPVTLFSEYDAPEVYATFGMPEFDATYLAAEARLPNAPKIDGHELWEHLVKERAETGRIYIMNADHVNQHGAWNEQVRMTNLCVEVNHITRPLRSLEDEEALIGVCVLAAVNLVALDGEKDFAEVMDLIVRMLNNLIDYQDYTLPAMRHFATRYRSLGIGLTNLAGYLAKNGYLYSDSDTPEFVAGIAESLQYYGLRASCALAREIGPCVGFEESKYALGILPIDTYARTVDEFAGSNKHDWESLRRDISEYGLRNVTISAQMPCESSSVVSSATNGTEPVQQLLTHKGSKVNAPPVLVPGYPKWKYERAFEIPNGAILRINAAIQKYFDMSMSTTLRYSRRGEREITTHEVAADIIEAYVLGHKSLYYHKTDDGSGEEEEVPTCVGDACAV